ncbi:hypothetical protein ACFL5V_05610 [Fibrobacterota bacterium]
MMRKKPVLISVLFLTALALLFSCATRSSKRFKKLSRAAEKKQYLSAIETIRKNPGMYGKTNQFLYFMDIGALFHYAELYDSSNINLEKAVKVYDELFARSVTKEAASLLTNDNIRPYRSKPYEVVLMHQYLALNYMAMGKFNEALVETRRTQLLFNEWDRKDSKGVKYTNDPMFHYLSSIAYDAIDETDNSMISLFKSIEAYNQGVLSLPPEIKNFAYYMFQKNDRASDIDLLKIKADVSQEKVPGLQNNNSEIILVGYAGKGPALEEISWWGTWVRDGMLVVHYNGPDGQEETVALPAPGLPEKEYQKASKGKKTMSGTTFHIKFAMPVLKTFPSTTKYFTVRHNSLSSQKRSVVINDLDKMAAKHLEDTRTATLIRTVIRVVLRTIASQKTKSGLSGSNPLANLLVNVGTDVLADQLEKADTRSCFLIPKTVQIARIPVKPGTHNVEVTANGVSGQVITSRAFNNIEVKANQKKFIFYSSLK